MDPLRQTAIREAHIGGTCGQIDLQRAARLRDLVGFEEFDFDRGEACGSRRTDAAKAQSAAELGIKRLKATIHGIHGIGLHEKCHVQDNAVGHDRMDDGVDCHGAKCFRQTPCKRGAASLQGILDQPAECCPPRRRHVLRIFRQSRLEPCNGLLHGDVGEYGVEVPGDQDLQLRAAFQLGEDRFEETTSPLEGFTHAHLVRRLRPEFHRQDRRYAYQLLSDLLMDQEQAPQLLATPAFQVVRESAADNGGKRPLSNRA